MEIIQERLDREYQVEIITTLPNVRYEVIKKTGEVIEVENPSLLPPTVEIDQVREPILSVQILVPSDFIGAVMKICNDRRGLYLNTEYLDGSRAILSFELPLSEVVIDFYDRLKSSTRGYASFDYEHKEMRAGPLAKLDILINGEPLDALSAIIHRDKAQIWGRKFCLKLKELIPRQMFEVIIQGAMGNKIIAREVVRPFRKNVIAKCYGGDITRKRKLLEKQKEEKSVPNSLAKLRSPKRHFSALKMERLTVWGKNRCREGEHRPGDLLAGERSARRNFRLWLAAPMVMGVVYLFVATLYRVPSRAMENTLHVGDYLLLDKLHYGPRLPFGLGVLPGLDKVEAGDLVVFKLPEDPGRVYIKRCIATSGQVVEIINKTVFVDGIRVADPPHSKYIDARIRLGSNV